MRVANMPLYSIPKGGQATLNHMKKLEREMHILIRKKNLRQRGMCPPSERHALTSISLGLLEVIHAPSIGVRDIGEFMFALPALKKQTSKNPEQ